MKIDSKHRKGFFAIRHIYKYGGEREKEILKNRTSMTLLEEDIVQVESEVGTCLVCIPEYKESACFICG